MTYSYNLLFLKCYLMWHKACYRMEDAPVVHETFMGGDFSRCVREYNNMTARKFFLRGVQSQ